MNRDLHFVSRIAEAFAARDIPAALQDAFSDIERKKGMPEFSIGYTQFQRFMAEVALSWARNSLDQAMATEARRLMVELASNTIDADEHQERAAREPIERRSAWADENRHVAGAMGVGSGFEASTLTMHLLNQDSVIRRLVIKGTGRHSMADVLPGRYELQLETGLLIWKGELGDQDLIWSVAYSGKPLNMAASTEEGGLQPTAEIEICGGELTLRVFAGPKSGRLEIEVV